MLCVFVTVWTLHSVFWSTGLDAPCLALRNNSNNWIFSACVSLTLIRQMCWQKKKLERNKYEHLELHFCKNKLLFDNPWWCVAWMSFSLKGIESLRCNVFTSSHPVSSKSSLWGAGRSSSLKMLPWTCSISEPIQLLISGQMLSTVAIPLMLPH